MKKSPLSPEDPATFHHQFLTGRELPFQTLIIK